MFEAGLSVFSATSSSAPNASSIARDLHAAGGKDGDLASLLAGLGQSGGAGAGGAGGAGAATPDIDAILKGLGGAGGAGMKSGGVDIEALKKFM